MPDSTRRLIETTKGNQEDGWSPLALPWFGHSRVTCALSVTRRTHTHRPLHHSRVQVPVSRRAVNQLSSASLHPADDGFSLCRQRARSLGVPDRDSRGIPFLLLRRCNVADPQRNRAHLAKAHRREASARQIPLSVLRELLLGLAACGCSFALLGSNQYKRVSSLVFSFSRPEMPAGCSMGLKDRSNHRTNSRTSIRSAEHRPVAPRHTGRWWLFSRLLMRSVTSVPGRRRFDAWSCDR